MNIENLPFVFFSGIGRCGSYLLRAILDWDEQVITIPISNNFYAYWENHHCNKIKDPNKIADIFLNQSKLRILKNKKYLHSYSNRVYDFSNFNWMVFEKSVRKFINNNELSVKNVYIGVYSAFSEACNKNFDKAKIVVADAFYNDYSEKILNDFPNARLLYLVRDHRGNISSFKAFYASMYNGLVYPENNLKYGRSLYIHILKDYMVDTMKSIHKNKRGLLSDKIKIIKYENIIENPKDSIKDLTQWFGISFNTSMMQLTRLGKPFFADSGFHNQKVKGFSKKPMLRWKSYLSKSEILMIEYLFQDSMINIGYKLKYHNSFLTKIIGFICCFIPWKGEILYLGHSHNPDTKTGIKNYFIFLVKAFYKIPINIFYFLKVDIYL